jgi:hypothetical protein
MPTSHGVPRHQAMLSIFEFLHTYCCKSLSEAYRVRGVSMLKSSSPLCCGFLHLFFVFVFRIVSSLLGGREICQVVCFRATSQGEHKLM